VRYATLAIVILAGTTVGCKRPSNEFSSPRLLATASNAKYHLTCKLYGRLFTVDSGKTDKFVQYVTIQGPDRNREIRYLPEDATSLEQSSGFFTNVWSPDGELLVLPLGRFEGFSITRSAEALQRIASGKFNDSVRVELTSGERLWHEFGKWNGPESFEFSAGLSRDQTPYAYDIPTGKVTTNEALNDNCVGVSSQGKVKIEAARGR